MLKHVLAVVGYIVATFVTQALSHFVVFKDHYDAVTYMMPNPIFALGIGSMIVQGAVLSVVYARSQFSGAGLGGALQLSWLLGAFLVSYIALAEAAKYAVPSVSSWIGVELLAGAVQFTLAGVLLWQAHLRG